MHFNLKTLPSAAGMVLVKIGQHFVPRDPSVLTWGGHHLPTTAATYDLGAVAPGATWRRLYLSGYAVLPSIGASAAQQHAIPAVASSTLAVLGAAQAWTGLQTFSNPIQMPVMDTSGAPGAAEVNGPAGTCAVAAGQASVVITNNKVSALSMVFAVAKVTGDATAKSVAAVVPGAGSFTVHLDAACTAAFAFSWIVVNPG